MDAILIESIEKQYKKGLPFVVYATPNNPELTLLLQGNTTLYLAKDFVNDYFVFAPFDKDQNNCCIPVAHSLKRFGNLSPTAKLYEYQAVNHIQSQKEDYMHLVQKAIAQIRTGEVKKIVTSRKFEVPIATLNLPLLLQNLFTTNPNTLRYIWYHPRTGIWAGATPELLLHLEEDSVRTMALAGTQKNSIKTPVTWSKKEQNEHRYVIDSIVKRLRNFLSDIQVSKTYDYAAGPVVHLRTDIKGAPKNGKVSILEIAQKLHPTPAVCGTPRNKARKFLSENENYDRSFYTGFLGPVEIMPKVSSLFVNLRCMKLQEDKAIIYVGGGITKNSNPLAEWEETNNKSNTMLQVLAHKL